MATNASRKQRGRDTEFIVAKYLKRLWPKAEAVGSGAPGTDVKHTEPIPWEVKARRGFDVMAALRQAVVRDGDYHPVVMRPDGYGETTVDEWPAILPLSELVTLLQAAGYGEPHVDDFDWESYGDDWEGDDDHLTLTVGYNQLDRMLKEMAESVVNRVLNEEKA